MKLIEHLLHPGKSCCILLICAPARLFITRSNQRDRNMKLREWNARLHGLVIFRSLLDDPVVAKFVDLTDRM